MHSLYKKLFKNSTIITLLSLLLSACGGGDDKIVGASAEPIKITSSSWKNKQGKSAKKIVFASTIQVTSPPNHSNVWSFRTQVTGIGLTNKHWQIHIDADNNPKTGYQFEDEAWSKQSGIDYIIEDGYLFKSTANDSSWSWNLETEDPLNFIINGNSFSINIDPSLIEKVCGSYNTGFISLDKDWNIEVFHPKANSLLNVNTSYCNIPNEPPVITLNGDSPMIVEQGSTFIDPGATATDKEDGDLTSSIISNGHVDTSIAGRTYTIRYLVQDSNGLSTDKWRSVIVMKRSSGITVDGNLNDWAFIPNFAQESGHTIKITDDSEFIYVSVTGPNLGTNTQLFIDTDINPSTGFSIDSKTGGDFMVENEYLSHYVGSHYDWAWSYNIAPMPLVRKSNILEMAIPKSSLNNLVNTPVFSFVSIDKDWNINFYLPDISKAYTLKHPITPINHVPKAVNDRRTATTNLKTITINALRNDSDSDGDALTITAVSKTPNGTTSIVNNKIRFTPSQNFIGSTTFSYIISDGKSSNGKIHTATAQITVVVTAANRAPKAVNDRKNIKYIKPVIIDVLKNDTDKDNDTLTITAVSTNPKATITIKNNKIRFVPIATFTGSTTFTYTISDGHSHADTAQVTITMAINHPPVATTDSDSTSYMTPITVNVLQNDTDPDGDTLRVYAITPAPVGVTTINSDNTITFDPQGHVGSFSIVYRITDRQGNNGKLDYTVLTISSTNPNDHEHNNWPEIKNEVVNTPKNKAILIMVLANDTDADGDLLHIDQVDSGSHGTTVKVNGGVLYTPEHGYTGTDEFYYGVHDGYGHNGAGKVTVTVTP